MCGIAGIVRFAGLTPGDRGRALRLRAMLQHRGPDGSGVEYADTAALVQTRLALVDPLPHTLPMCSANGRHILVYNGEVYNHAELRQELKKVHVFRTRTDTEVVLAALLHWGVDAFSRFEGMFALFLWDSFERTGLAAVDPLSVKPLLYHASGSQFAFCSEVAPLLQTGVLPFRPHEEGIAEYLTAPYFSGARQLPFANLQRLLPGHYLRLDGATVTTDRYRLAATEPGPLLPALRRAVAAQTEADAGVGMFLSGGVDSSLIAALAPKPLPAFTIDYSPKPEEFTGSLIVTSDDLPFATKVAAKFSHPHHVVRATGFERCLRRTLETNDLISAWEQEVSQNVLAEAAALLGKAVLVGDAADETHFGYSFLLHPERIASPKPLLEYFGLLPLRIPAAHFVDKYSAFARGEGYNWSTPDDQRLAITCLIRHHWLMRLLHNGDIHLMAHGVEGRVPFSDSHVVAAGEKVPLAVALAGGIEKHHLRTAAAEVLPPEIAWRPKSALSKNLAARRTIHRHFRIAWTRYGAYLEPYIAPDFVANLNPPVDDREAGLRFRLLALLTWFARFSEMPFA